MPAGRPPKYTSPDEIIAIAKAYFEECDKKLRPYTVTGLANSLGMTRQGLIDYGNKDEFADTVKGLKQIVEQYLEEKLLSGTPCTGAIFSAKNNFGWRDQTEVKNTHEGELKVTVTINGG
jgi:hypothetical protein